MLTTPPTWRDLGRRARRLGVTIERSRHEVTLREGRIATIDLASWYGRRLDSAIMRAMVTAALEQMEARR